jgi:cytochrome c
MLNRCFAAGASVLMLGGWLFSAFGQDKPPASVWDGVYTAPQAERGEVAYRESCTSCHGAQMEGKGQTPPLAGSDFTSRWDGIFLRDLFEKIQVSMPADRPGELSGQQNADILAYMLKFNQFPAGATELPASGGELRGTRFEASRAN